MWWLWRLLLEEVACRDKEKWYQCGNRAWSSREVYIKLYNTLRGVSLLSTHTLPWKSLWNRAEGLLAIVELEEVGGLAVEALLLKSQDGYLGDQGQSCISNYEKPRNPFFYLSWILHRRLIFFTFSQRNYTHFLLQSHILNDLKSSEYFVNYDFQFHLRRLNTVSSKITVVS